MTPWPVRFLNNTGDILPAFAIFRLHDGARLGPGELVLTGELVQANGEEALYVNSPQETADAEYGWCRSIKDPPFWVRHDPDNVPTAGDIVGPVEGETFVNSDGEGLVVLFVDTDAGILRCDAVIAAGTTEAADTGFPPGVECDCDTCFAGVTIPDATKCCKSHTKWFLKNPWLACETTDLDVEYIGNDEFLSSVFVGAGNPNEFRYHITIDVGAGRSHITLVVETDNGGDPVCLIYGRDSFKCQCNNQFALDPPYGNHIGVDRRQLSCFACLEPVPAELEVCRLDLAASNAYTFTVHEDVYAVSGPYDGGSVSIGLGFSELRCAWIGAEVNGYFPLFTYTRRTDTGLPVEFEKRFALCDSAWEWAEGIGGGGFGGFLCGTSFGDAQWRVEAFHALAINDGDTLPKTVGGAEFPATVTLNVSGVESEYPGSPVMDTGVCDETCDPPEAPVNPPGTCCFAGELYDHWDESLCNAFGGEWDPDGDNEACEEIIACCFEDTCITTGRHVCNLMGGTEVEGNCEDNPCDLGACCRNATGSCEVTTAADCVAPDYFWGADTDCDPDPCPGIGACCRNADTMQIECGIVEGTDCACLLLPDADCDGTYGGDGSLCGDFSCECHSAVCDLI